MKKALIPVIGLVKVCLPRSIRLTRASLDFCREKSNKRIKPMLTLESGFHFLLENGGRILIEREGTKMFPPRPPIINPVFLLEDGKMLLQEDGFKINLENND